MVMSSHVASLFSFKNKMIFISETFFYPYWLLLMSFAKAIWSFVLVKKDIIIFHIWFYMFLMVVMIDENIIMLFFSNALFMLKLIITEIIMF